MQKQPPGHYNILLSSYLPDLLEAKKSFDKNSNYKNVIFISTEGTVSACLGRAQDAYSISIFHAVVNLEPLHSLRQNKFHSSTNLLIISPSNVGKQH